MGLGSAIGKRLGGFAGAGMSKLGYGGFGAEMLGHFGGTKAMGEGMFAGFAKKAGLVKRGQAGATALNAGKYMSYARSKAIRSMGYHAAGGAAIGGINSYRKGDNVLGGAVRGGVMGGAIGGARMGYKAMNRIQGSGLYSQMVAEAKLMPKDFWKRK